MRYNTTNDAGREVQAMENSKCSLKDRLYEAMATRGKKAVDLTRDLDIPKSAISQYLSGKSQKMDSARLYAIAHYLDVDEPWLLGYDVPMKKAETKETAPENGSGLSEAKKQLLDLAENCSEEEAERLLQMMKLMLGK
jgi:transcriptional regulator with XRE-family HTH domain